jgi:hypothetical protein
MHLFIATASHLTSEKSVEYLNYMFRSVEKAAENVKDVEITFVLGMFVSEEKLHALIQYPQDHKYILVHSNVKKTQFDHFQAVSNELQRIGYKSEDMLMIMDDDDLLLKFPECLSERKIFAGSHMIIQTYRTRDLHDCGIDRLLEILPHETNREVCDDLSGHCCTVDLFNQYFVQRKTMIDCIKNLEDCKYMEFLAKNDPDRVNEDVYERCWMPEEAFIFHRLKVSSAWLEDTAKSLSDLCKSANLVLNK